MTDCAPLVTFEHVDCSFYVRKSRMALKKVAALRDVCFTLHEGEILGVVGHNGAGKSTLLQILGNILTPSGGVLHTKSGLRVSLLSLQLGFSPELTGRENAVLGAMFLGYSRREAEARLERILDFAELGDWVDEPVRTYSTGMAARLGFAVALEMHSDIMLIDEVMGVGDAYFQKKSSAALVEKIRSGQTVVLVSHSESTLRTLCKRVLWLHEGQIHMLGEGAAVLDAYTEWVARLETETAGAI